MIKVFAAVIFFFLIITSLKAQKSEFVPSQFSAEQFKGFSQLPGGKKILLFKEDRTDSCFVFDTEKRIFFEVNTDCCRNNGGLIRTVSYVDGGFVVTDQCKDTTGAYIKRYTLNETGFYMTDSVELAGGNFLFLKSQTGIYELFYNPVKIDGKTVINGLLFNNRTSRYSEIFLTVTIDTSLKVVSDATVDNSGNVHLFVYDRAENYKLNTQLSHFVRTEEGLWENSNFTFRKTKIVSADVSISDKDLLLTLLTVKDSKSHSLIKIKFKGNGAELKGEEKLDKALEGKLAGSNFIFKSSEKTTGFYFLNKKQVKEIKSDLSTTKSHWNLYRIQSSNENKRQSWYQINYDENISAFISSGYSKEEFGLLNNYSLSKEANAFFFYSQRKGYPELGVHSFKTNQTTSFKPAVNFIGDVTAAVLVNDKLWMPAFNHAQRKSGFLCVDLSSVNK